MDKVWVSTKDGRKAYRSGTLSGEELKVMEYIVGNHRASESQLEVVGGEGWLLRSMKRNHLIKEVGE